MNNSFLFTLRPCIVRALSDSCATAQVAGACTLPSPKERRRPCVQGRFPANTPGPERQRSAPSQPLSYSSRRWWFPWLPRPPRPRYRESTRTRFLGTRRTVPTTGTTTRRYSRARTPTDRRRSPTASTRRPSSPKPAPTRPCPCRTSTPAWRARLGQPCGSATAARASTPRCGRLPGATARLCRPPTTMRQPISSSPTPPCRTYATPITTPAVTSSAMRQTRSWDTTSTAASSTGTPPCSRCSPVQTRYPTTTSATTSTAARKTGSSTSSPKTLTRHWAT